MKQDRALVKYHLGNKQQREVIQSFVELNNDLSPYSRGGCSLTLCPVCGCLTYDDYFVCNVCGWEFDGTLMENEKSSANSGMSVKKYRKSFLSRCSSQIREEYKKLKKRTHNKYRLFDVEFITYNPKSYMEFYNNNFIDNRTKEYIKSCFDKEE